MNWTAKQKAAIEQARQGIKTLQDLEKEFGLVVAIAMWKEIGS